MPKKTKKNEQPVMNPSAASPQPANIEQLLDGTEAGRIWNDIKNREIFMFALPNQIVSQHCKPVLIDPSILYLVLMSSATLPSLEEAIGKGDPRRGILAYQVELADRFVLVKPALLALDEKSKR